MSLMGYVTAKALHLIPILYVLGILFKNTPMVPDWLIPWLLVILGVIGGCMTMGLNADSVMQGILAAGATVLGNQLYKQTTKK